jgi:purine-binding chemotaxis protein CheW
VFAVGEVEYAIDLAQLTRALPLAAASGEAVTVHETSYPLVDLRAVFALPPSTAPRRAVLAVRTGSRRAAIVVDQVVSLTTVSPADIRPLPAVLDGAERRWFEGLVRRDSRVVAVVNAEGLLSAGDQRASGAGWRGAA